MREALPFGSVFSYAGGFKITDKGNWTTRGVNDGKRTTDE
jgi:hypothetical protein